MAADAPAVSFLPLGAIVQAIRVDGVNVVLGFPAQEHYARHNAAYFGETIGCVANRIGGAAVDGLDGRRRALAANDGPNCLHGGRVGWGKRLWAGPDTVAARPVPGLDGARAVAFSLRSSDGDQGFPGAVDARVVYTTAFQPRRDGRRTLFLALEYEAVLVAGAAETVNMTGHSYFNLAARPTVAGTAVCLANRLHLPVDAHAVPVGGPVPFPHLDVTRPFVLGPAGPNVDSCFTLDPRPESVPVDTRARPLARNLLASHPDTGIHFEVLSTEPAFQFYTGHFVDVPAIAGAPARGPRSGFCCEPGRFVNAWNVPEWRATTLLKKGEQYGSRIVYRSWTE